ncbi:MAG TPA: methyl coenzyme M reductase system, component A2 [Candidatus Bathyarchaeia archaeon]|nr:methyl coenzyme M reductase system, component A2 [Candidatus Bathyarchaeia archaeon]
MAVLIEVENLVKTFGEFEILKGINFTLDEGEVLGIIGKSGVGKTVLLHAIRGLKEYKPTSGKIYYNVAYCRNCRHVDVPSRVGKPCLACAGKMQFFRVDAWADEESDLQRDIRSRVAIMLQRTFALYGDERAIENVMRSFTERGYGDSEAIYKASELIDQVKLSHRMMHMARDLSGGEKQRVVLARQLARSPIILLADEPTGTLDRKTAEIIHKIIQYEAKTNDMAVLVTSHLPEDIESMADRAILLDDGRIVKEGAPKEVVDEFLSTVGEIKKHEIASGDTIVKVAELEKKYVTLDRGVIRAVSNVSFDIQEGEVFGLIGLSGAGKTSVSKIIAGVLEPTNGEVQVRIGDDWVDMTMPGPDNRGRAKPYIGVLYQEYDLYPFRDVLDNLTSSIGLELPAELSEHKAVQTLVAAGFSETMSENILAKAPDELSQGERHRVALAQVLIREPNLVILDEPTGTMDPITKKDVSNSILTARAEIGETFMIVSHDLDFVREVCDRAALMRGGKIISIGPTAQVLDVLTEHEKKAS